MALFWGEMGSVSVMWVRALVKRFRRRCIDSESFSKDVAMENMMNWQARRYEMPNPSNRLNGTMDARSTTCGKGTQERTRTLLN